MKTLTIGRRPNIVALALGALSFAQEQVVVGKEDVGDLKSILGHGPANQPVKTGTTGKTVRVDASKLRIGTKSAAATQENASGLPTLPPPTFKLEQVEIEPGVFAFKCTAETYGYPAIKMIDQKDAKNGYKLTGKKTPRLQIAWTRRPVMITGEDEKQERMVIDVPDAEGNMQSFAISASLDFGGKLTSEVVKRGDREEAAQNQQA